MTRSVDISMTYLCRWPDGALLVIRLNHRLGQRSAALNRRIVPEALAIFCSPL
jgi:hypothetical protein